MTESTTILTADLWSRALHNLRRRITAEDWAEISGVRSPEDVDQLLNQLKQKYSRQRLPRYLEKCHRIIEGFRPFMAAVDQYAQVDPLAIGSLAWGSLRIVIELVSKSHRIAEVFSEALADCCQRLPYFKRLYDIFPMAPRLEGPIVEMYTSLMEMTTFVIQYFKTNPIKNLARNLLGKFQDTIIRLKDKITSQLSQVEQEERLADLEAQKSRHEILEKLIKGQSKQFPSVKPAVHIPFSRNPHFVGRASELSEISAALNPHQASITAPASSQRAFVLHGLGGMGKTEVSLEFAHQSVENFDSVLWVASETEQKADTSFSEIGASLRMQPESNTRPRDQVLQWLNSTDTTWLVIFDNAPDEDARFLRGFWPVGNSGSILVTTRNARLAREFSVTNHRLLGPIDEDASVKILIDQLPDERTPALENQARELSRQLGHLPLALSQTAGYLIESGCTVETFLQTYRDFENRPDLHALSNPGSTTGYHHNLSTVWAMTLSLLQRNSVNALHTLSILAFLDPYGFSQKTFEEACARSKLTGRYSYLTKAFPLQQSLRPLQSQHFITIDRGNGLLKVHRLLQDSVLARLNEAEKAEIFEVTVRLLYVVFPDPKVAEHEGFTEICKIGDKLYPHVATILTRYAEVGSGVTQGPELYDLIRRFFWYLHHRGLYKTAVPFFDIAIQIYGKDRDNNLKHLAFLQGTAGTIYRNSDDAARALLYFDQEIVLYEEAIRSGQMEENHERLAYSYEHKALALQQLGRYSEAFVWHGMNLHILENHHADDRAGFLLALVNKSWAMWKSGRLTETATLLENVIKEAQLILEKNAEEYQARRVINYGMRALGNVYMDQGRWQSALNMHISAFEHQFRTWGENHFETGVSCYKLGVHYERQGDMNKATEYFRLALSIFVDNPVPTESLAVRTRFKLGTILCRNGEEKQGLALLTSAREGRETLTGEEPREDHSMESYDSIVPYWAW